MLSWLYSSLVFIVEKSLPFAGIFSSKIKLFVVGRKEVFDKLQRAFSENDKIIWFHAASLGEYEQGVPVIKQVKRVFPSHKILLTFFSPSGYEVKKDNQLADFTTYLPLDTKENARRFLQAVKPQIAVFIKYEIWPNYVHALKKHHIKTILISGLFRENQLYFRFYGKFFCKTLRSFHHCFVQNNLSLKLLKSIGVENVTISGDTRFDRVSQQIEQDNTLDFVAEFKMNNCCVVCGSTWPEDEAIWLNFINSAADNIKFIIAPHSLNQKNLNKLQKSLVGKSVLYSEKDGKKLSDYQILIVNSIGFLGRIYSYADIAYVGGGMGNSGLHNILEPATFGVPIIIGENYTKFPEAKELRKMAGLFSVKSASELEEILKKLLSDKLFREKTGMITGHYVRSNKGATKIIMTYFLKEL